MVCVYTAYITGLHDPKEYPDILRRLSPERCRKIEKQQQAEKRKQSLGAGLLLDKVLGLHGISEKSIYLGEYGKPETEGIYFNLSHSGELVACAVSDKFSVGCDVEQIRAMPESLSRRCFSAEECKYLDSFAESDRNEEFIRLWTMKESYMKMTGEGLQLPLREIELKIEGEVRVSRSGVEQPCVFKEYMIPGYKLTVCSEDAEFADIIPIEI